MPLIALSPCRDAIRDRRESPNLSTITEKNLNWIRDYWAQLSALFIALGILLQTYTIWTYTNAIDRPDLMPGAFEAPSDLVTWLVFLAFVAAAYLLILMTTSMLFGLSISLFKDSPTTQPYLAKLLFWPVLLGIAALMAVIFQGPELNDYEKLGCVVLYIIVTIWGCVRTPNSDWPWTYAQQRQHQEM